MEDPIHAIIRSAVTLDDDFAITDELRLQEIPNLDSLSQVRLMTEIDQRIEGGLSMDEILAIESVGQIRSLLASRGKLDAQP